MARGRFRRLFGPDPSGDVDEELRFHLEMRVRELIAEGETPERARELAQHDSVTTTSRAANAWRSTRDGDDE